MNFGCNLTPIHQAIVLTSSYLDKIITVGPKAEVAAHGVLVSWSSVDQSGVWRFWKFLHNLRIYHEIIYRLQSIPSIKESLKPPSSPYVIYIFLNHSEISVPHSAFGMWSTLSIFSIHSQLNYW